MRISDLLAGIDAGAGPLRRDGVAAPVARPCLRCGALTDAVFFDLELLAPEPPRCPDCRDGDIVVVLTGEADLPAGRDGAGGEDAVRASP